MVGQTISHYNILEKLGEGGMGVVYRAHDTTLDRDVALKFLPPALSESEQDRARFVQEAKAAASLDHPNICTIHGIEEFRAASPGQGGQAGSGGSQYFFAMAFVEGSTLREKIPTLSIKQAVDIAIQVADGLSAAHEKGIVHRDIKPENVMIRKDGIAQVMDFGLAKLRSSASKISRLTKHGSTVGTAGYMSPEQVQGQDTDHRSDIFSFGVLLYEMLTGQLPFKGVHETALAYEIVNVDPVPMATVRQEVEPALDAIVLECLEKDVSERAQSMKQIAVDLKRYKRESSRQRVSRVTAARPAMQGASVPSSAAGTAGLPAGYPSGIGEVASGESGIHTLQAPERHSKLIPVLAAAGFLLAAVFLVLWSPWSEDTAPGSAVTRSAIALAEGYELVLNWYGSPVDISPDGKLIAYSGFSRDSGRARLFVRAIDSYDSRPIADVNSREIKFSPDGQWIYYSFAGGLYRVSLDGGAPVRVADAENPRGVAWGPDGSIYLAGGQVGGVLRIFPGQDSVEEATVPDRKNGEISHRFPSLLPGAKAMLLTVKYTTTASFDDANIVVHDLETGTNTTIIEGGSHASYVPTGHVVYVRGGSFYIAPFDAGSRSITGPTRQLFAGGQLMTESGAASYTFSANGTLVYAPGGPAPSKEFVVDWQLLDGRRIPLVTTPRSYGFVSLSPDRTRLGLSVNAANNDIWTYDIRRSTMQRLTFGGGNHGNPVWTPDGERVVYWAERNGEVEIYQRAWDGSGKEEKLVGEKGMKLFNLVCSPDGRRLLYSRVEGSRNDIWELALDSAKATRPVLQTPFNEFNVDVSPDGRWLAYHSAESGTPELYVVPYPSGEGRWQITSGGSDVHWWSRDGSEILYFDDEGKLYSVPVKGGSSLNPGTRRAVADFSADKTRIIGLAFDPVGMRWAIIRELPGASAPATVNVVTGWFDELRSMKAEAK